MDELQKVKENDYLLLIVAKDICWRLKIFLIGPSLEIMQFTAPVRPRDYVAPLQYTNIAPVATV